VVISAIVDDYDVASALNLRDRGITKLDLAIDLGVELNEQVLGTDHMVGGARVKHPLLHDLHAWASSSRFFF
jgi:hypothetical protein